MIKLHDNRWCINVRLDFFVGQNGSSINIDFVGNGNIITQYGDVLKASPSAYTAVPANNRALDPGMVLDFDVLQQNASLQTDTVTDNNTWADSDVWSNAAVLANLSCWMNQDIASVNEWRGMWREKFGSLLSQAREVQACTSQEVLWLTNVHPKAFEIKGVQIMISAHGREGLLLDGSWSQLDSLQHTWIQHVYTGIDSVSNKLDRLLDETVDLRLMSRLVHNNTIFRGLLNLGDNDGSLVAMCLVESS